MKIGVLGAGRIGRLHIANLAQAVPNAEVAAIADPFLNEEAVAFANDLGITKRSKNPQAILVDPAMNAVEEAGVKPSEVL